MASPNAFLTKAFKMFSAPEYSEFCGWNRSGDSVVVHKPEHFEREILPIYFTNRATFVRQLNKYGFQKCTQNSHDFAYFHPKFKQNRPDLLTQIKRQSNFKPSPVIDNRTTNLSHNKTPKRSVKGTILDEVGILSDPQYQPLHSTQYHHPSHPQSAPPPPPCHPPQQWNLDSSQYTNQSMNQPSNDDPNTQFILIPNSNNTIPGYNHQFNSSAQEPPQLSCDDLSFNPPDLSDFLGGGTESHGHSSRCYDHADDHNHSRSQYHFDHASSSSTPLTNNNHKRMRTDSFSSLGSFSCGGFMDSEMSEQYPLQVTNESSDSDHHKVFDVTSFEAQTMSPNHHHHNNHSSSYTHNNSLNNQSLTTPTHLASELSSQRALLTHHVRALNHKMNLLQNENFMLRHMFLEGHKKSVKLQERLDLVLKAIFSIYTSSNTTSSSSSSGHNAQAALLMQQMYALFGGGDEDVEEGGEGGGQHFGAIYQQLLLQDGPPALTNDTSNATDTTNTTDTTSTSSTNVTSSLFPPMVSDSHNTQSRLNNAYPAPPSFEQLIRSDSLMEFAAGMVDDLSGAA